jgi:hypothetical protein
MIQEALNAATMILLSKGTNIFCPLFFQFSYNKATYNSSPRIFDSKIVILEYETLYVSADIACPCMKRVPEWKRIWGL